MSSLRSGPQPYRQSPGNHSSKTSYSSIGNLIRSDLNSVSRVDNDSLTSGSSSVVSLEMSGQPTSAQPQNLASASAAAATSLLFTSSSTGSGSCLGTSAVNNRRLEEQQSAKQKSSSLSGYTMSSSKDSIKPSSNGTANGTSTYSNGSSLTGTGVTCSSGITTSSYASNMGNYRLASLDRLAQRQKLYDHQNGSGDNLQSKRELFFKNESSPAPALVTSINSGGLPPGSNNISSVGVSPPGVPKPDLPPMSAKIDALRTHHQNVANNVNIIIEDNRDKESKEKLKEKQTDNKRRKELDGYVGFANLPNQVYRKAVKKGFDFTLMVVGESGLGKSTLINSMFLADIYSAEYPGPSHRIKKTVQVETCKVLLKENGVNLTLTIVDTPGFGDAVDNSNCWQPVTDYIENRYEDYLNSESRVNRRILMDNRVHACLYFIAPSGHGLKPLDIELMKKLHDKVNIIPVLAKADTMTPEECVHFKKQVLNEIAQHKIKVYEFPDCDDEEENKINKILRDRTPFAVVGSNTVIEIDGKKVRGRKYPWGTVVVENMEHCDFVALRNMVVRTHLQDLKDVTNNVHYENFRCRKLAGLGPDGKPMKGFDKNPLAQMEEEKKNHESKMKKMEQEMEQVFEMKVKERNQRLIDSEEDLRRREDQMRKALEKLQRDVEDRKKHFESEKYTWEQANGMTFEELRRRSLEALSKEVTKMVTQSSSGLGENLSRDKNFFTAQCLPSLDLEELQEWVESAGDD